MKTEPVTTQPPKRRTRAKSAELELPLGAPSGKSAEGDSGQGASSGRTRRTRAKDSTANSSQENGKESGAKAASAKSGAKSGTGRGAKAEAAAKGSDASADKEASGTRRRSSRKKAEEGEGSTKAAETAKKGKQSESGGAESASSAGSPARASRAGKSEKGERAEGGERSEGSERSERSERSEKGAKADGQRSRRSKSDKKDRKSEKRSDKKGDKKDASASGQRSGRSRRRRRRGRGSNQGEAADVELQDVEGVLEIDEKGVGRLRQIASNFAAVDTDPEVPKQVIERNHLRPGVLLSAGASPRNNKVVVQRIDSVEGLSVEEAADRLAFMNLTVVDPDRRLTLETTGGELLTRAIDIVAPIGFGQRALIVAPPKTGKTIILQKIAKAVLENYPQAKLMVLLIDERPEEVTDFHRTIGAEVFGSSSDRPAYEHLRLAELVMERARRLVEAGEDVVVLLDSITRLARAYNKEIDSSGRTLSGGVDSRALERPKRLFGAARNTEEAGSLTIVGTALVDTGSRMDEVIFEEFKGTGNMEIVLDRQLAERRMFPAINVNNSGTRKEEKIFSPKENEKIRKLRQYLSSLRPVDAMDKLLSRLRDFDSNDEFFDAL